MNCDDISCSGNAMQCNGACLCAWENYTCRCTSSKYDSVSVDVWIYQYHGVVLIILIAAQKRVVDNMGCTTGESLAEILRFWGEHALKHKTTVGWWNWEHLLIELKRHGVRKQVCQPRHPNPSTTFRMPCTPWSQTLQPNTCTRLLWSKMAMGTPLQKSIYDKLHIWDICW